jgi:hypothetical protein
MHLKLYIGNSMFLRAEGVKFENEETFLNDGLVEATVKNLNGTDVSGQTWPLTLDYITDSDGNYQGVLSNQLELTERKDYHVFLTVTKDANVGHWKETVTAQYRGFDEEC